MLSGTLTASPLLGAGHGEGAPSVSRFLLSGGWGQSLVGFFSGPLKVLGRREESGKGRSWGVSGIVSLSPPVLGLPKGPFGGAGGAWEELRSRRDGGTEAPGSPALSHVCFQGPGSFPSSPLFLGTHLHKTPQASVWPGGRSGRT